MLTTILKNVFHVSAKCIKPAVATRFLVVVGVAYFCWIIYVVIFASPSTNDFDGGLFRGIQEEQTRIVEKAFLKKNGDPRRTRFAGDTGADSRSDEPSERRAILDRECFSSRFVYLVIPVASPEDVEDLCTFGQSVLADSGARLATATTTTAKNLLHRSYHGFEQKTVASNLAADFVAVIDPSKCASVDDPLKCGWIRKRSKHAGSKDAEPSSNESMLADLLPEIKVQIFISAANEELRSAAFKRISTSSDAACSRMKDGLDRAAASNPLRSAVAVSLDSVHVLSAPDDQQHQTLDGALSIGLHHALTAAKTKRSPDALASENATLPRLSIPAQTHFIASIRPHLVPTSPGLLRILLDTIIRASGDITPSRPSALNNVPLGMSARYPCTSDLFSLQQQHQHQHQQHNRNRASHKDLTSVIRRQAADRFFDKVAGASCLGLVSDATKSEAKNSNQAPAKHFSSSDNRTMEEAYGQASVAGSDFSLVPARFEGTAENPRVISVELQRSCAKQRFKLVHETRRRPMELHDASVQMSRGQVLVENDVMAGSCFMVDASAVETALEFGAAVPAGAESSSVESNSAIRQSRLNDVLLPAANTPIQLRRKPGTMRPIVNAERRLLFLYSMIQRVNVTTTSLGLFRRALGQDEHKGSASRGRPVAQKKQQSNSSVDADDDGDVEAEEQDLNRQKRVFDEFQQKYEPSLKQLIVDSKRVVEDEVGLKKHLAYLENNGWWLNVPTNLSGVFIKSIPNYHCRIGDATFYSMVHCWATLLGVRFAQADFMAEVGEGVQQDSAPATIDVADRMLLLAKAVDFLEVTFAQHLDAQILFASLNFDALVPAFQLLQKSFVEAAEAYRKLADTVKKTAQLAPLSESRLDLAVAGLSLALRRNLQCRFATALVARVEDVSMSRKANRQPNQGSDTRPAFAVLLPPNHPLRREMMNVAAIKARLTEKGFAVTLPFWIDLGGTTVCESERHVHSIFGSLPGVAPWTIAPLEVSNTDSAFTVVGSRTSCASNRRKFSDFLHHDHSAKTKKKKSTKGGRKKRSENNNDDDLKEKQENVPQHRQDEADESPDRASSSSSSSEEANIDQSNDESSIEIVPSSSTSWCSSSCSHPSGHAYIESKSVPAHMYPFTTSHSHVMTYLTGDADALASHLSIRYIGAEDFPPFSLSWIVGRSASSTVVLSGMEQFHLTRNAVRLALCFTQWCSLMTKRFAADTDSEMIRVAYPFIAASIFDPLETKQLFRLPAAGSNDDGAEGNEDDVLLPSGISLSVGNKMKQMTQVCSVPKVRRRQQQHHHRSNLHRWQRRPQQYRPHDRSTAAGDSENDEADIDPQQPDAQECSPEPFIIGAPIPWESGNDNRALESLHRLVTVIENVTVVTHCHIQVVVLLLHAPSMLLLESVVAPILERLSGPQSSAIISVCVYSTEIASVDSRGWNDHDTADFLNSCTIIIHPLSPSGWPHLAMQTLLLSKPLVLPLCCGLTELALPHEAFFVDIVSAEVEHRSIVNAAGDNVVVRHWTFDVNLTQVVEYIEGLQLNSFIRWVVARRGHVQAVRLAIGADQDSVYRTMKFVAGQLQKNFIGFMHKIATVMNADIIDDVAASVLGMKADQID